MYNPFSLEGKTVLVTGASSGIGQTTAIECSKLGAKLVITARNEERLKATYDQLEGDGHRIILADLSNEDEIKALVEQCPCIDGLVNNAGVAVNKPITFYNMKDIEFVYNANVYAPMLLNRWILKKKRLNNGGSIVFTSSIAAFSSHLGNGIYGTSKSALTSYMKYCARELAPRGIRANTVHPGMVETKLIHGGSISEEELNQDLKNYPLGRHGKPEEIAWQIAFLLSDASKWTTGTCVIVDGGCTL